MLKIGIDKKSFKTDYFEKNIYFQKSAISNFQVDWKLISEILNTWDLADQKILVHKNGILPLHEYADRYQDLDELRYRINEGKFTRLLEGGATVLFNRIDRKSTKLAKVCSVLTDFVEEKTVANGYAAFGGNGTFGKHWDTHDVFAVQLLGRKRWQVFKPTFELPVDHQKSKFFKHECPKVPIFDETLEAGDVLYIPRGWWHEAIPLDKFDTFHIAAGVHTAKLLDYFSWVCEELMPEKKEFRHSLVDSFECVKKLNENDVRGIFMREENIDLFIKRMTLMRNIHTPIQLDLLSERIKSEILEAVT